MLLLRIFPQLHQKSYDDGDDEDARGVVDEVIDLESAGTSIVLKDFYRERTKEADQGDEQEMPTETGEQEAERHEKDNIQNDFSQDILAMRDIGILLDVLDGLEWH